MRAYVCVKIRLAAATAQLAEEATAACNKLATSTVRTEFNLISNFNSVNSSPTWICISLQQNVSSMNRFAAPLLNGAKQNHTEQRAAAALSHHAAQHCKHKAFSQVPYFDPFTFLPEPGWASCPCLSHSVQAPDSAGCL